MRRRSLALANDKRPETNGRLGAVAQLGERLVCNQEATGSIPVSSTIEQAVGRQLRVVGPQENNMEAIASLGIWLIPIAAIVIGGITGIVKMVLNHQERIAMIERGIHPDSPEAVRK